MKNNIILIGFMGCGKTSVGKALAEKLHCPVLDTDLWIEENQHMTISEIFRDYGEDTFRKLETNCLEQLLNSIYGQIISVGGGLPVKKENHGLLHQLGTVIYLKIKPEEVYARLRTDKDRPLLQVDNPLMRITELLEQRESAYTACADKEIDVSNKSIAEIVQEIMNTLSGFEGS